MVGGIFHILFLGTNHVIFRKPSQEIKMMFDFDSSFCCSQLPTNPSLQPLHYIQAPILIETFIDAIKDATVPSDVNTAIAIAAGETVAGVVGGLASRGVAGFIGDKKRDAPILKGAFTGVFFGTRSFVRAFARLLGLPQPVAIMTSSIIGSVASEAFKAFGRSVAESGDSNEQNASTINSNSPTLASLQSIVREMKTDTIPFPEVIGDVSKWILFDSLLDENLTRDPNLNILQRLAYVFIVGAVSATLGDLMKQLSASTKTETITATTTETKKLFSFKNRFGGANNVIDLNRFAHLPQAAIEGGVLFSTYQIIGNGLGQILPKDFGEQRFIFDQILSHLESLI